MKNLSIFTKSAIIALAVAGAGTVAIASNQTVSSTSNSVSKNQETTSLLQHRLDLVQAIAIAKQGHQGELVSAKFDHDGSKNGKAEYEIELVSGNINHEIKLDAHTGKVLKNEEESMDKEDIAKYSALKQAKISLNDAMQQAIQRVNGQVIDAEFELEKGRAFYDIEVQSDNQIYDISIDANTGHIISSQIDTADADNDAHHDHEEKNERDENEEVANQAQGNINLHGNVAS